MVEPEELPPLDELAEAPLLPEELLLLEEPPDELLLPARPPEELLLEELPDELLLPARLPDELLLLVIRNGMKLVLTGAAIGFVVSLSLPRVIAAGFSDFRFHAAWVIAFAPVVIIVVGLVACYIPARRAMRVDPMIALRHE